MPHFPGARPGAPDTPRGGQLKVCGIAGWAFGPEVFAALAREFNAGFHATSVCALAADGAALPETPEISIYARQAAKLLNAPTVLIGWSMGAIAALEAALYRPSCITKLVLISATACFCSREDFRHGIPREHLRAMSIGLRTSKHSVLREFFRSAFGGRLPETELDLRARKADEYDSRTLVHGLKYLENTDLRQKVSQVGQPVLLLHGTADRIIPAAAARDLAERLPRARLVELADGSHCILEQQTAVLMEEVGRFLRE